MQAVGLSDAHHLFHLTGGDAASRLFLLYADGSGTEFLSSRTVEDFLDQAYSDPSVAVLREPLPDTQGVQTGAFQIIKYTSRSFKTQREKNTPALACLF